MRNWISLVESASTYMFWVTDAGVFLDCSGATHEAIAQQELAFEGDEGATEAAYDQGWIRVLAEGAEFGADWTYAPREARRALAKLVRSVEEFNVYYLNGDAFYNRSMAAGALMRQD